MKLIILAFALLIILCSSALSQTQSQAPPKMVLWSEDASCAQKNSSVTPEDNFNCGLFMDGEAKYRRFMHDGLVLMVRFQTWGDKYFIATASLQNQTDQPVPFNTKEWGIVYFANEAAFKAGEKPISNGYTITAPAMVSLDSLKDRQRSLDNDSFMADLNKTVVTREGRTNSGNPNQNTRIIVNEVKTDTGAMGASATPTIISIPDNSLKVLTEKAVPAKKEIYGRVYFALDAKSEFRVVSLPINGVIYIFPVPKTVKK